VVQSLARLVHAEESKAVDLRQQFEQHWPELEEVFPVFESPFQGMLLGKLLSE